IFVDSFGPFGAQLNAHHGFLNLAQILMYPVDSRNRPMTVRFSQVPPEWQVTTPLPSNSGAYDADNYDPPVHSPVELGDFHESDCDEAGGHCGAVIDADPADYDARKISATLHKIPAAASSWMNDRPFQSYTFFFHFPRGPAGGGMEHAYSTAIEINAE